MLEFTSHVRKPFIVEAIEVTEENIAELAPLIGELKERPDGTPFIYVTRKRILVDRVYIGYYVTKMGNNIHCYSKRLFDQQFVELTDDIQEFVDDLNNEPVSPNPDEEVHEDWRTPIEPEETSIVG